MTEIRRSGRDAAHAMSLAQSIIGWLATEQEGDGHFPARRSFYPGVVPHGKPTSLDGWYDFGKCPFITATVVHHLGEIKLDGTRELRERGCAFLEGVFEGNLVRYVPAHHQDIWFPADVDDTCLVRTVLRDNGHVFPGGDEEILNNRHKNGGFYTWFVPRWRHLAQPAYTIWALRDTYAWARRLYRQNPSNAWRLVKEYWQTREPSVDANVLLYFGADPRVADLPDVILRSIRDPEVRLEYYHSLLVPYFHVARLYHRGHVGLGEIADECCDYILQQQDADGRVENGFGTALAALSLMYFQRWGSSSLAKALDYLVADTMHSCGWLPQPYMNPVNREFSDGAASLTAVLYAEALYRFADRLRSGGVAS